MLVKTIPVGQLETNCYVVTNEETLGCVVIDPVMKATVFWIIWKTIICSVRPSF